MSDIKKQKIYKKVEDKLITNPLIKFSGKVLEDTSLQSYNLRIYNPEKSNDTTKHFDINDKALLLNISEGFLSISFTVKYNDNPPDKNTYISYINNAPLFLLRNATYSINGITIDKCENVGRSTLMNTLCTYTSEWNKAEGLKEGFSIDKNKENKGKFNLFEKGGLSKRMNTIFQSEPRGHYQAIVSLSRIFGFCKDLNKVLINLNHHFTFDFNESHPIFCASHKNNNGQNGEEMNQFGSIKLDDIKLTIPYCMLEPITNKFIESNIKSNQIDKTYFLQRVSVSLILPEGQTYYNYKIPNLKGNEKLRKLIFAFQENRDDINQNTQNRQIVQRRNRSIFDHLNIKNYSLDVNDKKYPTSDTYKLDFVKGEYNFAYQDYVSFFHDDLDIDKKIRSPMINPSSYKLLYPLFCIVCKYQIELKSGSSYELSIEFNNPIPVNCKIHIVYYVDKIFTYKLDGSDVII